MKLFCFSYAGGSADFYNDLKNELPNKGIELIALDYPGHGSRRRESFLTDFYDLSWDLLQNMRSMLDGEKYALMGYSMGSIVATEVVKRILDLGDMQRPEHVFLAAHEPKTLKALADLSPDVQDKVLMDRTISFGAVPEELVDNKTFWRMYMPLYRADYTMIGRYDFENLDLSTDIGTTVFYSESDTPYEEIKKWSKYYYGDTQYFQFDGNHFFIKNYLKEITDIILDRLSVD